MTKRSSSFGNKAGRRGRSSQPAVPMEESEGVEEPGRIFDPSEDLRGATDVFSDQAAPRTDHEKILSKTFLTVADLAQSSIDDLESVLTKFDPVHAAGAVLLQAKDVRTTIKELAKISDAFHAHRNKRVKNIVVEQHIYEESRPVVTGVASIELHAEEVKRDETERALGGIPVVDTHTKEFHDLLKRLGEAIEGVRLAEAKLRGAVEITRHMGQLAHFRDAQLFLTNAVSVCSKALDHHCDKGMKKVSVEQRKIHSAAANENDGAASPLYPKAHTVVRPPDSRKRRRRSSTV
ncbi:MAG TPA: hypothetical protein VIM56_07400 [Rhizomicrobium sp.]